MKIIAFLTVFALIALSSAFELSDLVPDFLKPATGDALPTPEAPDIEEEEEEVAPAEVPKVVKVDEAIVAAQFAALSPGAKEFAAKADALFDVMKGNGQHIAMSLLDEVNGKTEMERAEIAPVLAAIQNGQLRKPDGSPRLEQSPVARAALRGKRSNDASEIEEKAVAPAEIPEIVKVDEAIVAAQFAALSHIAKAFAAKADALFDVMKGNGNHIAMSLLGEVNTMNEQERSEIVPVLVAIQNGQLRKPDGSSRLGQSAVREKRSWQSEESLRNLSEYRKKAFLAGKLTTRVPIPLNDAAASIASDFEQMKKDAALFNRNEKNAEKPGKKTIPPTTNNAVHKAQQ